MGKLWVYGFAVWADTAVEQLLSKFADRPGLPEDVYQVADRYRRAGGYDRADQLYRYLVKGYADVGTIVAQKTVAMAYINLGQDDAADAVVDRLVADFNDHPDLSYAIFVIGEEYYNRAFQMKNEGLEAESEDCFQKAVTVWEKIRSIESRTIYPAHAYYFSAVCYRRLGEYENAIEYFQVVVDNWPGYQYAWSAQCLIGECYEKLRNSGSLPESEANPKIVQAYKAVIEKHPRCSLVGHACLKLGNMNFGASQWDEAARYFGLFLEKCPEDIQQATALYRLGKTYENMGESDTAMEVYRIFLEEAESGDRRIATVRAKLKELGGQK